MRIKNDKLKSSEGVILILALIALAVLSFLTIYFTVFSLGETKMTSSFGLSSSAYYLAESGIQEAIFKLKTEPSFREAFETLPSPEDPLCSNWFIAPFSLQSNLVEGGSYEVFIQNMGCAQAIITATSTVIARNGQKAQRVVKTKVFKAMGSALDDFSLFTGGAGENISIQTVNPLHIYSGDLFSNNNILVKLFSDVETSGKVLAVRNINVQSFSQLSAIKCAANVCDSGCDSADCPPEEIAMPSLDFDSTSPASLLSKAQNSDCSSIRSDSKTNCLFSPSEFQNLMWSHYPDLALPTSTFVFVTGDISIMAGQRLALHGVLASQRDISIGSSLCWAYGQFPFLRCGFTSLAAKKPQSPANAPSGLLAKRKLETGAFLNLAGKAFAVEAVLYAGDALGFSSSLAQFEIKGGIVARKMNFSSLLGGVAVYLNADTVLDTLGGSSYSPVITIDHWEEEY